MPKRRGSSSPAAATKKLRKPPSRSPVQDNGVLDLSPTEESGLVVETETASTSSSDQEGGAADQVMSDEESMDLSSTPPENGEVRSGTSNRTDWIGSLSIKQEFLETFKMLDEPSKEVDLKSVVEACKEVFKRRFTNEELSEKRQLVDHSLREYLLEKLVAKPDQWNTFLDLSIELTRAELCSATAVISLLTDLVEVSRLNDCSHVFDYVESHLEIWKDPLFYTSGKNSVLRMCNDLLRRQSRAQNTVFCGRILIFLANYFPFSERSGLNIMSEFNVDNLTTYKTGDGTDDPDDKMETTEDSDEKLFDGMDLEIPGLDKIVSLTQEEKKRKIKVDYNLYVKFWSLQEFFRSPQDCYNKISWKTFTMYTQDVLGAFHSFKLDEASHRKRRERTEEELPSINPIPKLGDENLYFAKYLTNRRLLELQMSDPSFRRYFLVQLIVILQYLTVPVKFKSEAQVLGDDQLDFVKKTSERIYELLSEIPPRGRDFVKCVKHILKREELWNKWKNDGCQPFKKPVPSVSAASTAVSEDEINDKLSSNKIPDDIHSPSDESKTRKKKKPRRPIGDSIKEAVEKNKYLLGHTELTRLWNICPDNLEACRLKTRDFMPQLDVFFAEAFKEMETDPTPMSVLIDSTKKEFKQKKILGDPMFGWKALRLLARRSPYFFQMFGGAPISPLQNYLEYVLRKINADREPIPNSQEDISAVNQKTNEMKPKNDDAHPNHNHDPECAGDGEQVMEAGTADDDELLRSEDNKDVSESGDEEEGEVNDKFVRRLTEEELRALTKGLGDVWKKLSQKLGFKSDEVEYFEEKHKEDAPFHMLKNWQDQDEDATAADLIYQLEGLKLRQLVADVFKT